MKKAIKKFAASLSAFAMLVMSIPIQGVLPVSAADPAAIVEPVESGISLTGTNALGEKLLAASEYNGQQKGGSSISDIVIEDGTVTAKYVCESYGELIVGFYSEDGSQLLASCSAPVFRGETETVMMLPEDCPEEFYLKAYMLDDNQIPLSAPFETNLYSSAFSEVRHAVVTDYDSALTVNLDENEDTNFLVLNDSTLRIESDGTQNVLESIAENVYTFTNADELLSAVKNGDILYYSDAQHGQIIMKADAVKCNGTTVTLTDAGAELEDAFALIKIEVEGLATEEPSSDFPDGIPEPDAAAPAKAQSAAPGMVRAGDENPLLEGERDKMNAKWLHLEGGKSLPIGTLGKCGIEGSLDVGATMPIKWKVYYEKGQLYGRVDIDMILYIKGSAKISAEATLPIFGPKASLLGLAELRADIGLRLEGEVEVNFNAKITVPVSLFANETVLTVGAPTATGRLEVNGSLFAGIVAEAGVSIGTDEVYDIVQAGAGMSLEIKAGVQIEADGSYEYAVDLTDPSKQVKEKPEDVRHDCELCLDGEAKFICTAKGEAWIRFGHSEEFKESEDYVPTIGDETWQPTFKKESTLADIHLFDFYYSFDHNEWGLGECPYKQYQVRFHVINQNGTPISDATVFLGGGDDQLVSVEEDGTVDFWRRGNHEIPLEYTAYCGSKGTKDGSLIVWRGSVDEVVSIYDDTTEDQTPTESNEDDWWRQYYPSGELEYKSMYYDVPRGVLRTPEIVRQRKYNRSLQEHFEEVRKNSTYIMGGVGDRLTVSGKAGSVSIPGTSVFGIPIKYISGDMECTNLTLPAQAVEVKWKGSGLSSLHIPQDTNLKRIEIESSNSTIKELTLPGTPDYTRIYLPSLEKLNVTGDLSIKYLAAGSNIKEMVFTEPMLHLPVKCIPKGIEKISLPEGLIRIEKYDFYKCTALKEVTIPSSVESIKLYAFSGCTSLTSIAIPNSVKWIEDAAFKGCTALRDVYFSDGEIYLGNESFSNCPIESITFGSGLKGIDTCCFQNCKALKTINLPKEKINIYVSGKWEEAQSPYVGCTNLTSVNYPGTMAEFEETYSVTNLDLYYGGMANFFGFYNKNTRIHCTDGDLPHEPELIEPTTEATEPTMEPTETTDSTEPTQPDESDSISNRLEYTILNDNTVRIDKCFYHDSSRAQYVYLPDTVEGLPVSEIGDNAYDSYPWDPSLTYCGYVLNIPRTVTRIGAGAFDTCPWIEWLSLPLSLESVGENAFSPLSVYKMADGHFASDRACTICYAGDWNQRDQIHIEGENELLLHVRDYEPNAWDNVTWRFFSPYFSEYDNNYPDMFLHCFRDGTGCIDDPKSTGLQWQPVVDGVTITECLKILAFDDLVTTNEYGTVLAIRYPEGITHIDTVYDYLPNKLWLQAIEIPQSIRFFTLNAFTDWEDYSYVKKRTIYYAGTEEEFWSHCYVPKGTDLSRLEFVFGEHIGDITDITDPTSTTTQTTETTTATSPTGTETTTTTINPDADDRFEYTVNDDETLTITKYSGSDVTERLDIPNGIEGRQITQIGDGAFRDCTVLKGVNIPEGVTAVGEDAFSGCSALVYVGLPDSLTSVANAFDNCSETMHFFVPKNASDHWKIEAQSSIFWDSVWHFQMPFRMPVQDGYDEGSGLYYTLWDDDTIVITGADNGVNAVPSTINGYPVVEIGDSAFKNHTELLSFHVGENVKNIEAHAFEGCTSLCEMEFPRSLQYIRMNALSSCTELLKIYYPDDYAQTEKEGKVGFDIREGESYNIGWIESYSSIQVPDPAEDADYLEELTDVATGLTYRTYADGTAVIIRTTGTSVTIPEQIGDYTVRGIMSSAFVENRTVQNVTIKANITELRNYTFRFCMELYSVELPLSLTYIGRYSFHGCTSLKSIVIPENVKNIDDCAFYKAGVEYVAFPLGLELIDTYAFEGCNVKTIYFQGENNIWGHGLRAEHHNDTLGKAKVVTEPTALNTTKASMIRSAAAVSAVKTFTYTGTPGTAYLLIAVKDVEAEDLLSAEKLLYIDQQTANENGEVTFRYVCPDDAVMIFVGDIGKGEFCRKVGKLDLENEECTLCKAEEEQKADEKAMYALFIELGDVNDDDAVNASDAAQILIAAAAIGAGNDSGFSDIQHYAADVNDDGSINASDAAIVLIYAAAIGAGQEDVKITDFVH